MGQQAGIPGACIGRGRSGAGLTHSLRLPQAAPSLIVHGDADKVVPIAEGETMYAALSKTGVPASFVRIEGAGHRFDGAHLTRADAEMVRWFELHPRGAAKWNLSATRIGIGPSGNTVHW